MHQYAAVAALGLGVVLVVLAAPGRARLGALVYGVGLTVCLGMSAVYHRVQWTARMKALLCKVDHSTIFLLIAGTSTPIILCTMRGLLGWSLLIAEWTGAAGGIGIALLWRHPPVWVEVGPYLLLGWLGVLAVPALISTVGVTGLVLLASGGALFTIGSLCYAAERPDPWPSVFGFHEVFHGFVTSAAAAHAVLISIIVLRA
jgi:hemolysin III